MSTKLTATGEYVTPAPTLTVSSGRGNTGRPEIHLHLTADNPESETTTAVFAWFDRDELTTAIKTEDTRVRRALEVGEPA